MSEIIYLKDILLAKASSVKQKRKVVAAAIKSVKRVKIKSALVERPKKESKKLNRSL